MRQTLRQDADKLAGRPELKPLLEHAQYEIREHADALRRDVASGRIAATPSSQPPRATPTGPDTSTNTRGKHIIQSQLTEAQTELRKRDDTIAALQTELAQSQEAARKSLEHFQQWHEFATQLTSRVHELQAEHATELQQRDGVIEERGRELQAIQQRLAQCLLEKETATARLSSDLQTPPVSSKRAKKQEEYATEQQTLQGMQTILRRTDTEDTKLPVISGSFKPSITLQRYDDKHLANRYHM